MSKPSLFLFIGLCMLPLVGSWSVSAEAGIRVGAAEDKGSVKPPRPFVVDEAMSIETFPAPEL